MSRRSPGTRLYQRHRLMNKRVERQVNDLLADAASRSSAAGKGTPLQQVGDV